MKRREFITLLAGTAATFPLAAHAQQRERMRRIGVLVSGLTADDPEWQARGTAFVQALQQLGWTDGRNVRIDTRFGLGDADRLRKSAAELVALSPDVILAGGGTAVPALQQATRTLPIVFANVGDPVGLGLVSSLAQPGGNTTGFMTVEFGVSGR
jgi:putative ABC transport system substrate-binding protein